MLQSDSFGKTKNQMIKWINTGEELVVVWVLEENVKMKHAMFINWNSMHGILLDLETIMLHSILQKLLVLFVKKRWQKFKALSVINVYLLEKDRKLEVVRIRLALTMMKNNKQDLNTIIIPKVTI